MKKYILKKDLPFAKAGTEVRIYTDLESEIDSIDILDNRVEISNMSDKQLLNEGWIEEVKPREFYINKTKSGELFAYYKEENAIDVGGSTETIKVVECI